MAHDRGDLSRRGRVVVVGRASGHSVRPGDVRAVSIALADHQSEDHADPRVTERDRVIAWLEIHEALALIAIAGTLASAWLQEKREARAEARRESRVGEIELKNERLGRQVDGYLSQIAELEIRIRQLEGQNK